MMIDLKQRLNQLEQKVTERNFLTGRGTVGEINFWIVDYPSKDELIVREHLDFLVPRVNCKYNDVQIKCFDLFSVMMTVLRERNYLDAALDIEKDEGSEAIIEPLRNALNITDKDDLIIAKITENLTPGKDIIFLTGVGKVWPIVRSHTILNNLHDKIERNPLVMFFPGEYTSKLELFEEITDDNYYRAFRLI